MNGFTKSVLQVFSLFLLTTATFAFGQFTAGVQGTVQDESGAAISGAAIALTNVATQVTESTQTNGGGDYHFTSLGPGNYVITATASGFGTIRTEISLVAGETRSVPIKVTLSKVTSTVTVTSQSPLLDTADSRNQLTLGETALSNLPLATRNPTALITLTPGVVGLGAGSATNFGTESGVDASANGRSSNGNLYVLDGLDVTSIIRPGVPNLVPNADTLSEVTVQSNTYTVDFGRASSIQTIMSTRPGTTQIHGFASEYYTYQGLQARGEYGIPKPLQVAPFHTNNMSFGVGGPIIPNHQFFFFVGFEPYFALASNGSSLQTIEDPAFVAFAQQVMPNSPEVQLLTKYPPKNATFRNIFQTAAQAFGPQNVAQNTGCETPATDNIPCGTPVFDQSNFNSSSYNNSKQYDIRIDKYFSKDRVYGLFYRNTISTGGPAVRPAFATTNKDYTFSLQGNETHTFSPNTLNEGFIGYNRIEGISPASGLFTVPVVNVTGLGVGFGDGFALGDYIQKNYHWRDVLSHVRGTHAFKLGYEGWHGDDIANFAATADQPNLTYTNIINLINDNPYSETGFSYNPVTGKPLAYNYVYAMTTGGVFVEDTWKTTKKLTLNYGVRYDDFGNAYPAAAGTNLSNLNLGSGSSFPEQIANGVLKVQSHVYNHDMNWIFSPRFGFAYDPLGDGKWVVRGGYGVYHDWFTLGNAENGIESNPPGPVQPTFFNNGSTAPPIFSYGTQNTYPFGFQAPAFQGEALDAKGGIVGSQIGLSAVDVKLKSPTSQIFSLTIEHELGRTMVASIGYAGSHSGNLVAAGANPNNSHYGNDVNIFPGDLVQHPIFNATGGYSGSGTQTRLNTSFGSIDYAYNNAHGNYSGLIAAIQGRFTSRGFLTASYTHSKSMDNWGNYPIGYPTNQFYAPSNDDAPNRFSLGWSYQLPGSGLSNGLMKRVAGGWTLAGLTVLQSGYPFSVYTNAPLAISKTAADGTALTSANYAAEEAAGNLQLAPGSGDFNADGDVGDYPNVTSYKQKHNRKDFQVGHGIFDPCPGGVLPCGNFSLPALGQLGNETPNQFRNAGYADTDFTLKKVTPITERFSLELRLDTFNLFNRVNLIGIGSNLVDIVGVDGNLQDGAFGQTSSTLPARNMLLGARLNF